MPGCFDIKCVGSCSKDGREAQICIIGACWQAKLYISKHGNLEILFRAFYVSCLILKTLKSVWLRHKVPLELGICIAPDISGDKSSKQPGQKHQLKVRLQLASTSLAPTFASTLYTCNRGALHQYFIL